MFFVDRSKHVCVEACATHRGKGSLSGNLSIREDIIKVFLSNCAYCGARVSLGLDLQIDHFIPKAGGHATPQEVHCCGNLVLACSACNGSKSASYPVLDPCKLDESCNDSPSSFLIYKLQDGEFDNKQDANADFIQKFNKSKKYINRGEVLDRRRTVLSKMDRLIERLRVLTYPEAENWNNWNDSERKIFLQNNSVAGDFTVEESNLFYDELILSCEKTIIYFLVSNNVVQDFYGLKHYILQHEKILAAKYNDTFAQKIESIIRKVTI